MIDDISKQQEEINRKIDEAYDRLDQLKGGGAGVSEELKGLNALRDRFSILSDVNDQLEKLEKIGGGDLFWGEGHDLDAVQQEHTRIRNMVTNYDSRVAELQSEQQSSDETIESLTARINVLNEDTVALLELEEELMEEFIIEREMVEQSFRAMAMPWNKDSKDQKQFRKVLLIVLFLSMLLGILIPLWDIPIPDRVEVVEIPERLAKLIVPKKAPPPPPPKQEKLEEKKPEKEKVKKDKKPVPEKAKKSRKKAEKAGLMAFKDDFADLINDKADAKLGAKAKVSGKGSKAKKTTRSLVTSNVGTGSSGINTASLSRNVGGSGDSLGGVEFSRVESSIGTDFDGEETPLSGGHGPSRTDEEIQIVFDRYKAALYRIYNRELRKNPTLQGKMVLRITIEPDGSVSASAIDSSDMDSA
ncbi:MAG: AgmX/PglI C-terminal domain-containing protein, partial [Gammaproteobacteria bacterium]|nr:AgmX/PglI C-terminal domain-containing protein [Gammaproteobacteria bacterium]